MSSKKSPVGKAAPNDANDILETAEVVRSANCLLRMAAGIFAFANQLCVAEVFSDEEKKTLNSSLNSVFSSMEKAYASLMGRYSALVSAKVGASGKVQSS